RGQVGRVGRGRLGCASRPIAEPRAAVHRARHRGDGPPRVQHIRGLRRDGVAVCARGLLLRGVAAGAAGSAAEQLAGAAHRRRQDLQRGGAPRGAARRDDRPVAGHAALHLLAVVHHQCAARLPVPPRLRAAAHRRRLGGHAALWPDQPELCAGGAAVLRAHIPRHPLAHRPRDGVVARRILPHHRARTGPVQAPLAGEGPGRPARRGRPRRRRRRRRRRLRCRLARRARARSPGDCRRTQGRV
ncbi:hypothetical protein IWQ56_007246, partial [Coemansia nantahalensis]